MRCNCNVNPYEDMERWKVQCSLNLGTASSRNVPEEGDASADEVVLGNDTRLYNARPASDVYEWAKEPNKPTYTKEEIGLGNVTNDAQVKRTEMGVANGVATLDENGKVTKSQLYDSIVKGVLRCNTFYTVKTEPGNFVDLGLPSGIKWATMNVGALTVADYGQKFSWGGTNGYTNDQVSGGCYSFSWANYELGNGGNVASSMTKYNSTDGLTVLEAEDDAATVNMGSGWRMPTDTEFNELLDESNCTYSWTSVTVGDTTVDGCLFTSVRNGNTLFFPAGGSCSNNGVYFVGRGYYWSSSLLTSGSSAVVNARSFYNLSGNRGILAVSRSIGYSVRGVTSGSPTVTKLIPVTPDENVIYVDEHTNKIYSYDGTSYVELSPDTTYTAGDNITISSGNVISTVTKFWCGTVQEWGQISGGTLDANTIYLIH